MIFLAEETGGSGDRFEGPLMTERAVMATATDTLSRLGAVDTSGFTRQELAEHTLELAKAADRVQTVTARFLAFADANAAAITLGQRKMSGVVHEQCGMSRRQTSRLNLLGAAADRYRLFYEAVPSGRIGAGHIEALHPIWLKVNKVQFAACEELLVELAEVCTPEEFAAELAKWWNYADEDAGFDEFVKAQAQQHLAYGFDVFGNVHYSGTIGPLHAEPFIETLETEAANQKTGKTTPSQARGKALVELVLNPDGKYRARLEIIATQNHDEDTDPLTQAEQAGGDIEDPSERHRSMEQGLQRATAARYRRIPDPAATGFAGIFHPRTDRGTLIPPAIVEQLKAGGAMVTVHLIDEDGNLIADRPAGRHFTDTQKRMIRLRDNQCRHPGCRTPARRCEYDHIEPYERDGPTLVRNGQALCKFHHRYKHRTDRGPNRPTIFDNTPLTILLE